MFLHSNIAEVQLSRPVDVWFKNTVQLCAERGIPVVGEIFMASANEELQPLTHIAAPRLVAEELDAVGNVPNIQGVKEYFGLTPDRYDPNQLMAGIKLHDLAVPNEQALAELAVRNGCRGCAFRLGSQRDGTCRVPVGRYMAFPVVDRESGRDRSVPSLGHRPYRRGRSSFSELEIDAPEFVYDHRERIARPVVLRRYRTAL